MGSGWINSKSIISIKDGVTLIACGNVRVLVLAGFVLDNPSIASLALDHRPALNIAAILRWQSTDGKRYPALVTIETDGNVSASYFDSGTTIIASISNGTLSGSITWIVR